MSQEFNPVDGMPAPVRPRKGSAAEFKLLRLREVPTDYKTYDDPRRIVEFWRANIATAQWYSTEQECCCVVFLSTRKHIIGFHLVSMGTMDTILVHPRDVFRTAIVAGAASIVLGHNHPSGDPSPSEGDIKVTRDLQRAGQLLKIEVLDHVIIGADNWPSGKNYTSLRELGYLLP